MTKKLEFSIGEEIKSNLFDVINISAIGLAVHYLTPVVFNYLIGASNSPQLNWESQDFTCHAIAYYTSYLYSFGGYVSARALLLNANRNNKDN